MNNAACAVPIFVSFITAIALVVVASPQTSIEMKGFLARRMAACLNKRPLSDAGELSGNGRVGRKPDICSETGSYVQD